MFIVVGFIEFAFILLLQQHNDTQVQKQNPLWRSSEWSHGSPIARTIGDKATQSEGFNTFKPAFNIRKIDVTGFFAFGFLYLLFNAMYWAIFLIPTLD